MWTRRASYHLSVNGWVVVGLLVFEVVELFVFVLDVVAVFYADGGRGRSNFLTSGMESVAGWFGDINGESALL